MSTDKKESTRRALENFYAKQENERLKELGLTPEGLPRPRRRNNKPEKITQHECTEWMRGMGWQIEIYESKATLSKDGVWRQQAMKAGTPDCQGVMPDGVAVAVEFKAKGCLSGFNQPKNHRQKEFILGRIHMGAFACVVDSVALLETIYKGWLERPVDQRKGYLLACLPKEIKKRAHEKWW